MVFRRLLYYCMPWHVFNDWPWVVRLFPICPTVKNKKPTFIVILIFNGKIKLHAQLSWTLKGIFIEGILLIAKQISYSVELNIKKIIKLRLIGIMLKRTLYQLANTKDIKIGILLSCCNGLCHFSFWSVAYSGAVWCG